MGKVTQKKRFLGALLGEIQMLGVGDWEFLVSACFALLEKPQMVETIEGSIIS